MGQEARAWITGAVAVAAVLWPLVHGRDGYPLSTYPMFARPRPALEQVDRAVGVRGDERVQLPLRVVGSDEPMQVVATLGSAIRGGRAASLCADIAGRVGRDPELAGVAAVEIATERHDAVAFFASDGDPLPLARTVRARCEVRR
jgi:hypothetical protein